MGRKKVKLQWIENDAARRVTYQKRVKNLMKKVKEISILCDVDACAVVNSPYDPKPEVWPSPSEVARVVHEYENQPDSDQVKKTLNQENFLRQRLNKGIVQFMKLRRKNVGLEMDNFINQLLAGERDLQGFPVQASPCLIWSIDNKLKAINQRIQSFPTMDPLQGTQFYHPTPPLPPPQPTTVADPPPPAAPFFPRTQSFQRAEPFQGTRFFHQPAPPPQTSAPAPTPTPTPPAESFLSPPSQPNAAVAPPPSAVSMVEKTPLELAIESLDYQFLMSMNSQVAGTSAQPWGQDMAFPDQVDYRYEESSFWENPYFP